MMIQHKKFLVVARKKRRHSRISSTRYSIHVTVKLACSVKVIRIYSREETSLLSLATTKSRRETIRISDDSCTLLSLLVVRGHLWWIISKLNLPLKFSLPYVPNFFFFSRNRILLSHNPFLAKSVDFRLEHSFEKSIRRIIRRIIVRRRIIID